MNKQQFLQMLGEVDDRGAVSVMCIIELTQSLPDATTAIPFEELWNAMNEEWTSGMDEE